MLSKVNTQYLSRNISGIMQKWHAACNPTARQHRQPLPIHTRWSVILPNYHLTNHPITKPESQ